MRLQQRIAQWVARSRPPRSLDAQAAAAHQQASGAAWEELFDALPRGWMIGRPPPDAASGTHRLYAFERRARRRAVPELTVEADSEEQAVRDLADQLRNARLRKKV